MYNGIPAVLKTRPFQESLMDSPFLIMTRIYIEFIYLKSLCVLHRRHMVKGSQTSITSATTAAIRLVERFLSIQKELEPGGLLETHQWMVNSFSLNDFFMGVTTLCLSFHIRSRNHDIRGPSTSDRSTQHSRSLLTQSLIVCERLSTRSKDATKVSQALRLVLSKTSEAASDAGLNVSNPASWEMKYAPSSSALPTPEMPMWDSAGMLADPMLSDLAQYDPFEFLFSPEIDFT
jgi:hypothetical protein